MRRSVEAYLWDIHKAGCGVLEFTAGRTLDQYRTDRQLRLAVERSFEIIGEAIAQTRRHYPEEAARLTSSDEIVAFRNLLIHRYHAVLDTLVWDIVQNDLPLLVAEVTVLLDEWHQG